jgi:antitoxin component of RelBE/YafQ-DinJ toxin-antitoxin module
MQIDKELKDELKKMADEMCITVSKLVNSILRDYIRRMQKSRG